MVMSEELAPQGGLALVDEPSPHVLKQLQGLLNGAVTPRAGPPLFPAAWPPYEVFVGIYQGSMKGLVWQPEHCSLRHLYALISSAIW